MWWNTLRFPTLQNPRGTSCNTGDAYDCDPAELSADILGRLLDLHAEQADRPGKPPDVLARRTRLVALARE